MPAIVSFLVIFLPSRLKIACLRAVGAKIGSNCRIGFSVVSAKKIEMGDYVHIGHMNLIWRLERLELGTGSRVSLLNWITGGRRGSFRLGVNGGITVLHFLDASGGITIGANSIVSGRGSQLFTHGVSPDEPRIRRPITIGDWCSVGSAARFVPGAGLPSYCILGMGAVVTKAFTEDYVLMGGVPARIIKRIPTDAAYFNQPHKWHAHHDAAYVSRYIAPVRAGMPVD